jgi:hypothetical protein
MGKEHQFSTAISLSELKEKAERLEKLSAQRAALAKRVGIQGKVKSHTSLETAQRVGRVRSKVELSSEIFAMRANDLRHELRAYEQAPAVIAEWQRRAETFTALSAEHYRGNVKKTDFVKAYKDYKEYTDSIERHLPTIREIERRRQEERERQESPQLSFEL